MKPVITQGKRLQAFRENPVGAAVALKLVKDQRHAAPIRNGAIAPETSTLSKLSQTTATRIEDARNIFAILPETELVRQILVSCIVSPNDLRSPELTWKVENSVLAPALSNDLLKVLREHFEKVYKIKNDLPEWLSDALFEKGSHPLVVLPESSIDDLINVKPRLANETFRSYFDESGTTLRSLGFLGNPTREPASLTPRAALESAMGSAKPTAAYDPKLEIGNGLITVIDSFDALKLPKLSHELRKNVTKQKIRDHLPNATRSSLEAIKVTVKHKEQKGNPNDLNSLYRNKQMLVREVQTVATTAQASRAPIGHPLVLHCPAEAVIPVTLPGSPKTAVGYFILIDELGNPLSRAQASSYYNQLNSRLNRMGQNSGERGATDLLSRLNQYSTGLIHDDQTVDMSKMYQAYGMVVDQELKSRIKNGINGQDVEIAKPEEAYRIMLARQLANQRTQLLWIPEELMTYVAYDYDDFGIGVSLIERSKILSSIRAVLTVTNTLTAIKNSTARRSIEIQLDPREEDPRKAVDMLVTEIARVQGGAYPIGSFSPVQIQDNVRMAGIEVNVTGHPAYPETKVSQNDIQSNRVEIDSNFDDTMRKRWLMSFGLTPETIDTASGADFAASVIQSNALLNKRVAVYQETTSEFLVDHVRKYTQASGGLLKELYTKIVEYINDESKPVLKDDQTGEDIQDVAPDDVLESFLDSLKITLPAPDSTKLETTRDLLTNYQDLLKQAVEEFLPRDVLAAMGGSEGSDRYDQTKAAVISYFTRKFMAENNILPELQELLNNDELEQTGFNLKEDHLALYEALQVTIGDFVKGVAYYNDKRNEQVNAELEQEPAASDDTTTTDTTEDTGGDDDFGGDDSFGDDFNLDEEPETEETETEPEETEEPEATAEETPKEEPGLDEEPT